MYLNTYCTQFQNSTNLKYVIYITFQCRNRKFYMLFKVLQYLYLKAYATYFNLGYMKQFERVHV